MESKPVESLQSSTEKSAEIETPKAEVVETKPVEEPAIEEPKVEAPKTENKTPETSNDKEYTPTGKTLTELIVEALKWLLNLFTKQ